MNVDRLAKDLLKTITESDKRKTSGYDTTAKVLRVDGDTAWVHIPGGVEETPVRLSINARPGDEVNIRVSGGSAWITGNNYSPPTDDKVALEALEYAKNANKKQNKKVQNLQDEIEDLTNGDIIEEIQRYCLANQNYIPTGQTFENIQYSAWSDDIPEYVTGKYFWHRVKYVHKNGDITFSDPWFDGGLQVSAEARIAAGVAATAAETAQGIADQALGKAEGTEKYFWHDSSGAHVSDTENRVDVGNSQTISSNGTIIMRNGKLVTSWTGSSSSDAALNFYDCTNASARTGDLMASYTRAGIILYANNKQALSVTPSGMAVYKSDGSSTLASFTGSGISFADDVPFTIGNSNSFVKWVYENGAWKIKICADEIQMGGKDVMTGGVAVNDNLVNVGIWDSSFATNPIGWTKENDASLSYSSSTGLMTVSCSSQYFGLYQAITVKANTKYTISAKVGASYHIGFGTSQYTTDDGTGWKTASNGRVYKTFTTGSSTTYYIYVYAKSDSNCIINDIKIEEGEIYTGWAPGNSSLYMTYVSPTYGVRIYSGARSTNTYAQINANTFTFVKNGSVISEIGTTTLGNANVTKFTDGTNDDYMMYLHYNSVGFAYSSGYYNTNVSVVGNEIQLDSWYYVTYSNQKRARLYINSGNSSNPASFKFYGADIYIDQGNWIRFGSGTSGTAVLSMFSDSTVKIAKGPYDNNSGMTEVWGKDSKLVVRDKAQLLIWHDWEAESSKNHGCVELNEDSDPKTMFRPTVNGKILLGSTSYRWKECWVTTGAFNTSSDLKEKDIIDDFDWKIDNFILGLRPIAYRYKQNEDGEHPRIHLGFGAQDIAKLSSDLEIGDLHMYNARIAYPDDVDKDGLQNDRPYHGEEIDDEYLRWGLSYNELIAPVVMELQRLMQRVDTLERTVSA